MGAVAGKQDTSGLPGLDSRSKQEGYKMAACSGELSTHRRAPPRTGNDHFVKFSFSSYGN